MTKRNILNALELKRIEPGTTKSDGEGLYYKVDKKGYSCFIFKYSWNNKIEECHIGSNVTLAEARKEKDRLREMVKNGINPRIQKQREKTELQFKLDSTFRSLAEDWLKYARTDRAVRTVDADKASLIRDVFPVIGNMPITDIKPIDIIDRIIRPIEARTNQKRGNTNLKTLCRIKMVFDYAIAKGICFTNPARDIKPALRRPREGHFPALTEPKEFAMLLREVDNYFGDATTRYCLQFSALVAPRSSEVRFAKWSEIDFEKSEWNYHVHKTRVEQTIPLSHQAIAILSKLKEYNYQGPDSFVFGSDLRRGAALSDNTLCKAFERMGFKGKHTHHGFRASFNTIMRELGYKGEYIEKSLSHKTDDPNGEAYNRAGYLRQRKNLMQIWADFLDEIKQENSNIEAIIEKYTIIE